MRRFFAWVDDRTGIAKLTREALFESVPGGARWRYVWGSTLSFAIMVQFITGIFLWMAYSPSATTAIAATKRTPKAANSGGKTSHGEIPT